jgi:hypothetical protein
MNEENNENLLNEVRQINNQNQIKEMLLEDGPGLFNLDTLSIKMRNLNNANNASNVQSQSSQPKVSQTVFNNLFNSAQVSESKAINNTENLNNASMLNNSTIKQPLQTPKEQTIDAILNNSGTKAQKKKNRNKQSKEGNGVSGSTPSKKRVKSSKSKEKNKLETDEENKIVESKEKGQKSRKSKKSKTGDNVETSEKKKTKTSKTSLKKKKSDIKPDGNQATINQYQFDLNKIKLGKSIKTTNQPADLDGKENDKKKSENQLNDNNE